MEEQSILKKILSILKKYILIFFIMIINLIRSLFGKPRINITKEEKINTNKEQLKKENINIGNNNTSLPDEDNIKANPHNTETTTSDSTNESNKILKIPNQKLYKVYTKDNELKYLPLKELLDLIIKEELERIYKIEGFKLKTAPTSKLIKVEQIKERIFPEIITRVENETLRTDEIIREEVVTKLKDDLIKNPLFPPRNTEKKEQEKKQKQIYTLAHPKKKDLNIKKSTQKANKKQAIKKITTEKKEKLEEKTETISTIMVPLIDEIPKPTLKDNLKDAAIIGAVTTTAVISEIITPPKEDKKDNPILEQKERKQTNEIPKQEPLEEKATILKEEPEKELERISEKKLEEEIKIIEEKNKKELEELKEKVEKKIEELKQEQKKDEEQKAIIEEKKEHEISSLTEVSNQIISNSQEEIKKEDFFEKDYERIERQIDKMLEDLTNTYLKYDGKLSEKQKKKLKAEEERLRNTKERIKQQKSYDIHAEQIQLDETIKQSEIDGLQNELLKIHNENQQEVSNSLLDRMKRLEGMTAEQVANVDKRIMLKRFNKANILLEMTSLLALPFIRNKYFFYFTIGLVIDNHFNFINAFFNRKYNRYEPADLEQIKQGQDALNSALDITYKNIVELEYLEQRALGKYPELAYDPQFINQVTRLKTNLNKKYNNLMKRNKILEKYRLKTKKHQKILKPELNQDQERAA
ncbi:MAG: hypothetical protein ACI4XM_07770 [Candidatus Coprovivens sp.]